MFGRNSPGPFQSTRNLRGTGRAIVSVDAGEFIQLAGKLSRFICWPRARLEGSSYACPACIPISPGWPETTTDPRGQNRGRANERRSCRIFPLFSTSPALYFPNFVGYRVPPENCEPPPRAAFFRNPFLHLTSLYVYNEKGIDEGILSSA